MTSTTPGIRAVAFGAYILVCREINQQNRADMYDGKILSAARIPGVVDVISYPIGILAASEESNDRKCSVILPKGQVISSSRSEEYYLASDKQKSAEIVVVEAAAGTPENECHQLGKFTFTDLPSISGRKHTISMTMRLDNDGLLVATAHDAHCDKTQDLAIKYQAAGPPPTTPIA